jgi:hypothetical protein
MEDIRRDEGSFVKSSFRILGGFGSCSRQSDQHSYQDP